MSKIRDTDYLTISARVRAMENRLVTRERMERMVEARSDDEAVKVLAECGYEELPALTNRGLDELLSAARAALYRELGGAVPDKRLVELFQMKYDYHNAKALVKGAAPAAAASLRGPARNTAARSLPLPDVSTWASTFPPGRSTWLKKSLPFPIRAHRTAERRLAASMSSRTYPSRKGLPTARAVSAISAK